MAAMSLQSGMISEPPVNVNDSDHFEPACLSMGGKVQEAEMKTNRELYTFKKKKKNGRNE